MTGFSREWLSLREPADHAARDPGLVAALAASLADRPEITVVDLGCGTGSNLRGLAPHLGARQSWRLVDHDPDLLAAARGSLIAWSDSAAAEDQALVLIKEGRRIVVSFLTLDLSPGPGAALETRPDLVTAAALFDLVSRQWLDDLVTSIAGTGSVFYTSLSYDGVETWEPPHPTDHAVHEAFLAHQAGDKGFGAALGREATTALTQAFLQKGYAVAMAPSPWKLGAEQAALIGELKEGKAAAAAETRLVAAEAAHAWSAERSAPGTRATIGHADLLAIPPR